MGFMELSIASIVETAYRVFHPFTGLVSWKIATPVSAIYHSLSVASIAGGVAEMLTDNRDEVDLAIYGGLVHDFYQKVSAGAERISKENCGEILRNVLSEAGLSDKLVDRVLDFTNVNVAENPRAKAFSDPVASLSIWLADTVASVESAYAVVNAVETESWKLRDIQVDYLRKLSIDIVSATIPQTAVRSFIYREIYRRTVSARAVPVLARDGMVIIRRRDMEIDLSIDVNDLKPDENIVLTVMEKAWSKSTGLRRKGLREAFEKKFRERYRTDMFIKEKGEEIVLDESVRNALVNIELEKVKYSRESKHQCLFCGYPVPDPVNPGWFGYALYDSTGLERWSPRTPPLSNLNYLFQERNWLRSGLVLCPLCVLEGFVFRRVVGEGSFDFATQFYFPLPTHFSVADYFSRVALNVINRVHDSAKSYIELGDVLEDSFTEYGDFIEQVKKYHEESREKTVLVDSTWSTTPIPVEKVVSTRDEVKENKEYGYYLPGIATTMYLTGLYPARFSARVEPWFGRELLSPVKPLYSYDPADRVERTHTPLVLLTLAVLSTLNVERISFEDISINVLDYVHYPFTMYQSILLNHRIGRKGLEAYRFFRENPVGFYKQVVLR